MAEEPQSYILDDLKISVSYSFQEWLSAIGGTVAVTNMGGGLIMVSCPQGKVRLKWNAFIRATGLAIEGGNLILGTEHSIHYFMNFPKLAPTYPNAEPGTYDGLYLPRRTYYTGRINTHDIAVGAEGALWIANTSYSCICGLSDQASFDPRWKPPFVSLLTPEDRCHLNGLTIKDGYPKYVTCLGATDVMRGWKPLINTGGLLMDTDSNEFVLKDLAMPHSPRWYNGKLYFLNSAAGEFCVVDIARGKYDVICALPGMVRGLSFVGDTAIIGLSLLRAKNYSEMPRRPVEDRFDKLICGVALVNLKSGAPFGLLQFTSVIGELYETGFIPGLRNPLLISPENKDEVKRAVHLPGFGWWLPEDDKKSFAVNPGAEDAKTGQGEKK